MDNITPSYSEVGYIDLYKSNSNLGRRDRVVVGLTTAYAISALDTTLCDKVCQLLTTGRWFSEGNQVSSTNKTDRHNINKILLEVA
jgi:hypothetical protein